VNRFPFSRPLWSALAATALLAGVLALPATAMALGQPHGTSWTAYPPSVPNSLAYAIVDGRRVTVEVGSVIGKGQLNGNVCEVTTPIQVGGFIPNDATGAPQSIVWRFTPDCSAIVTSISEFSPGPSPASVCGSPTQQRVMDAQYTIQEQFGVTATQLDHTYGYDQRCDSVDNPRSIMNKCFTSHFPGWNEPSCSYSLYDAGLYIQSDHYGEFRNTAFCRFPDPCYTVYYEMHLWTQAASAGFGYNCELTKGSKPPSWDNRCYVNKVR